MKPIETIYKGYRFRSRLEARWAVFLDGLNIRWEYEKEGYDLGEAGWYLPDFWLPGVDGGTWLEVKGEAPGMNSEAVRKLAILCSHTDKRGLLVFGEPYENLGQGMSNPEWMGFFPNEGSDFPYLFCLCPWCNKVGISFDGRGARVCGWEKHSKTKEEALAKVRHLGHWRVDDKCYTNDDPIIEAAAVAARQARFEHGENGARK